MHRQINGGIVSIVAAIAFVLLTCASAAAQDVKYNYAMGTNFSKYKTYKWVDVPRENHPDQIADQQIRTAIETTLGTKGFTKATGDAADILIAYQIAVNQERQWNAYGGMGGLRFGGMGTATSSTINIGTLVFDVFDAAAIQVDTWLDSPDKAVIVKVTMQALPDGTSYPGQVALSIPSSKIEVQITKSNYQKVVP